MFFDYFDRNECCCSAKIWSVVIKQTGFRCMSLGSCKHVSEYRFVSPRLWHVQTSTHIHKMMVIRRKSCCTVLQNVVNIAACTRFQSYIYIYVHTLCTLYYCHCRLRSCHIDRETWCCAFFFSLFSAPFFFFFSYVAGEKMFLCFRIKIVMLSQLFLQNVHASHVGMKKKSTKFIVWFFFVLI